jgi:hypothetical protein
VFETAERGYSRLSKYMVLQLLAGVARSICHVLFLPFRERGRRFSIEARDRGFDKIFFVDSAYQPQ